MVDMEQVRKSLQEVELYNLLQEILREVREIKDYIENNKIPNPYIKAFIEGKEHGENLICYNPTGDYYYRNKDYCKKHPKKWLKEAKKRIKDHNLPKPNWNELGRDYLRQENGNQYKNITSVIQSW